MSWQGFILSLTKIASHISEGQVPVLDNGDLLMLEDFFEEIHRSLNVGRRHFERRVAQRDIIDGRTGA